ncbi:MAG: hypothetical protein WC284_12540 [Candidimonas sp.]
MKLQEILIQFNELINFTESVFYRGEIPQSVYSIDTKVITILKNPSKLELRGLLNKANIVPHSIKELRGFITDDDLFVWDSTIMDHHGIYKAFGIDGNKLYFYDGFFKIDDWYLRNQEVLDEFTQYLNNHPSILRIYGNVKLTKHPQYGWLCFMSAK